MYGTVAFVDVETVWGDTDGHHIRTQFIEHAGSDLVGRPVCAIHDDLVTPKIFAHGVGALAELDVTPFGMQAFNFPEFPGDDRLHFLLHLRFDGDFDLVGQLLTGVREKLDAVVVERIVGCTDDNAGLSVERAREVGYRRCRHGTEQNNVDACRRESGLQSRLEHVAGNARILTNHHRGVPLPAQYPSGRPAELEHELRGYGVSPYRAPNAVGPEILALSCHPTMLQLDLHSG